MPLDLAAPHARHQRVMMRGAVVVHLGVVRIEHQCLLCDVSCAVSRGVCPCPCLSAREAHRRFDADSKQVRAVW